MTTSDVVFAFQAGVDADRIAAIATKSMCEGPFTDLEAMDAEQCAMARMAYTATRLGLPVTKALAVTAIKSGRVIEDGMTKEQAIAAIQAVKLDPWELLPLGED